jgi:hypothetical protein
MFLVDTSVDTLIAVGIMCILGDLGQIWTKVRCLPIFSLAIAATVGLIALAQQRNYGRGNPICDMSRRLLE